MRTVREGPIGVRSKASEGAIPTGPSRSSTATRAGAPRSAWAACAPAPCSTTRWCFWGTTPCAARGFAHLGVYRAIKELGLAVDWVGGTSLGAIMAAVLASPYTIDEGIELAREAFVGGKPFSDFTLPLFSLIGGRRMDRLLRKHLDLTRYVSGDVGLPTLKDIMAELEKPGRDPRPSGCDGPPTSAGWRGPCRARIAHCESRRTRRG